MHSSRLTINDSRFTATGKVAYDPQAMRRYSRSYAYDNAGNISEMAHTATGGNWTRDYSYTSGKNRLASTVIGATTVNYTHDNHGNIESLPNTGAVTWDSEDRIKEADLGGGGTAYYTYNAEGQRVRKVIHNNSDIKIKETIYLDGYELYHEFASGSIDFERETVHIMALSAEAGSEGGTDRIAMAETLTIENGNPVTTPVTRLRYQISDHLGSGSIELSETGAMISFEEYYPYGGTSYHSTSSTSQVSAKRYRYNGKEKDEETNLYYYGARYYISWLGRWMSCDPIGEEGSGLNLYRYASNNPIMRVDPTGMADIPQEQSVDHWTPEPEGECREAGCGEKQPVEQPKSLSFNIGKNPVLAQSPKGGAIIGSAEDVAEIIEYQKWELKTDRQLQTLGNIAGGPAGAAGYGVSSLITDDVELQGAISDMGAAIDAMGVGIALMGTDLKKSRTDDTSGMLFKGSKLSGKKHPVTGVKFDKGGFPQFEAKSEIQLKKEFYYSGRTTHEKQASHSLYSQIQKSEKLATQYTQSDINRLSKGLTPKDYTWHHHQDIGRMQLIEQKIHQKTGHLGGYEIWGKGTKKK